MQVSCRRPRQSFNDIAPVAIEQKDEKRTMKQDFTTTFSVDQSPQEVFDAARACSTELL
jgi:hypothetical protein